MHMHARMHVIFMQAIYYARASLATNTESFNWLIMTIQLKLSSGRSANHGSLLKQSASV